MIKALKFAFAVLSLVLLIIISGRLNSAAAAPPSGSSHIIVFKDTVDVNRAVPDVANAYGLKVGFTYRHALKGMSAVVPAGRLNALQNDPRVAYVVEDMVRSIDAQTTPNGIRRIFADGNTNLDIDGSDDFRVDVDVAVIDTGVDFEHYDLNVVGGVDCAGGGPFGGSCSPGGDDNHYHGTHVAGTIGAIDNGVGVVGVAPGARIWSVKVLNQRGSGYTSWIVAGIDWVTANKDTIEVANMSLGGSGYNDAEYQAIQGAVNAGVAFAVAAGNDSEDAQFHSPAAFDNVLTVSALADFDGLAGAIGTPTCRDDEDDTIANFSNYGPLVDIAAPGVCILSTFPLEQGEYGTISGTSMASPHAAGALALLASLNNPNDANDVDNLYAAVQNAGNFNWTDESPDGILEPLLDVSGFGAALIPGGGGSNLPPTVTITSPAENASFTEGDTITVNGNASDSEDGNLSSNISWSSSPSGLSGTGASASAVLSADTYVITAEVTDSNNMTDSDSITIVVNPASGGFSLGVRSYKVRGVQTADLTWSDTAPTNVDIYRDGNKVGTNADGDRIYTDSTGQKGGGSATYQVCQANDTSTCSNSVTVNW